MILLHTESKLFPTRSLHMNHLKIRKPDNQMNNVPITDTVIFNQRITSRQFPTPTNQLLVLNNKPFITLNPKLNRLNRIRSQHPHRLNRTRHSQMDHNRFLIKIRTRRQNRVLTTWANSNNTG
ncbi:hypothetical protein HanXRQr2_Chr04g0182071 [Helianthus annuus]|uniref:Uncharacterized protein n=1 Tax=Helianthus annuus TaxID=4232 RepID=A0A9K3J9Z5_HELAN|nr:hypothetical protein HanXRQr2_Chr04g0182071 [Helianthus annuus]KAJ0932606.1 hypothetical protein HanPSC8_Chr04g0175561 [Helianthus annuus]